MASNDLTDKGEQQGDAPEVNRGSSKKGGIQEDDAHEGQAGSTQPGGGAQSGQGHEASSANEGWKGGSALSDDAGQAGAGAKEGGSHKSRSGTTEDQFGSGQRGGTGGGREGGNA